MVYSYFRQRIKPSVYLLVIFVLSPYNVITGIAVPSIMKGVMNMSHITESLILSDMIEIISIIVSLITSIIAIAISVKTLQQNNKMIEESTRPNIQIYSIYLNTLVYIIIKNFGQSTCTIDSISCNHKFSGKEIFNDNLGENIFDRVCGAIVAPGYAIRCPLIGYASTKENLHFYVKYHSSVKTYEDTFDFNLRANSPFADTYPGGNTTNDHLKNISKDIHDLIKIKL